MDTRSYFPLFSSAAERSSLPHLPVTHPPPLPIHTQSLSIALLNHMQVRCCITPHQKPLLEVKTPLHFFPTKWTQPYPTCSRKPQVLYLGSLLFLSKAFSMKPSLTSSPFSQVGMVAMD